MIREINLKTGKETNRDYTEEEISKRDSAFLDNATTYEQIKILNKLSEIDMRSIRALREGDAVRIKALENEAKEIRKGLK